MYHGCLVANVDIRHTDIHTYTQTNGKTDEVICRGRFVPITSATFLQVQNH